MKLLILSDIHGDWECFLAAFRAERSWDAVAFCGDVVDYGPYPVQCLHWVAKHAEFRVRGNHDNALAFDVDCHCMGSFRKASLATRIWHNALFSSDDFAFFARSPRSCGLNLVDSISAWPTPRRKEIYLSTSTPASGGSALKAWNPITFCLATRISRTCAGSVA